MKPWTRRQPRRKPAPTLSDALDRYLAEVSSTKKGRVSEQSIARIWRATRLAIRTVDRIRSSDLIELRDEWLKDRAPATVVRRMAFLSHVFTVIRKDWGFDQLANPVQLVRRPAVDDARDRRLFDRITLREHPMTNAPARSWIGSFGRRGQPNCQPSSPLPRKRVCADPKWSASNAKTWT